MRTRHWMRGLAVALMPAVAGIAIYVARDSVAADPRRDATATSSVAAVTRGEPTYKGKTFDQWQKLLDSELDSAQRRDSLWAVAVLGANGRSDDAARAILDVIDSLSGLANVKIEGNDAVLSALPELKADYELLMLAPLAFQRLGSKAAPVALEAWRDADRSLLARHVALSTLAEMSPISKSLADTLVEALCDAGAQQRDLADEALSSRLSEEQLALALVERLDGPVLSEALLQLVAKLPPQGNKEVVQRLVERSRSKYPAIRRAACLGVASAGLLDPEVAQRFDVDRDELYTAARIVAEERLAHPSLKNLRLDQALALLKDGSPLARDAMPVLEQIAQSSDKHLAEFQPAANEALRNLAAE